MKEKNWPEYIDICIGYRVLTLVLSSMMYVAMSFYAGSTMRSWAILLGMLVSCLLSSWLYRRIGERELWLRVMFVIETFAYGVFTLLSGGLSSPYLWYQMSCILLMIALERHLVITLIASIWCLLCAVSGRMNKGLSYQELNVVLGMLIVIGGFYVLRLYIGYIDRQKELLIGLNQNLEKEKERSEYAFLQLAGLYETFHLFAMTNPEKIIHELSLLLKRAIAPSGCILIKFDSTGLPERKEVCGIEKSLTEEMLAELESVRGEAKRNNGERILLHSGEGLYEARLIGEPITSGGIFIRKTSDEGQENEDFYWSLIEIIFSNLDTHSQMERFITMEEQNRIANEIHDTVIQKLFGVVCSLKVLESKSPSIDEEELRQNIDILKKSVELTMTELRESIYGRNFKDTINTFVGAMTLYMEEAQLLSGATISMDIDEGADYLTSAQKIAVYRISCEAVNNAIRHGGANNVTIDLKIDAERIELEIQDNGKGFVESKGAFYEGNGLKNMRNIAALLKGSLIMDSDPGKGMRIKLSLPR